ncbi:hypothetical protein A2307_03365 [Candidatus Peregrinibacteria bacterium RIFOXYB2_FULL_33_20]|nr:MAG: hypothetical protein A2307_03365 [Candidatus Peregrinibacteria bacterium RIFOXYB2_FULL_33_20]
MFNFKFLFKLSFGLTSFLLILSTSYATTTTEYDCSQNICLYINQTVPQSFVEGTDDQRDVVNDTFSDGSQAHPFITIQSALDYISVYPNAQNYFFVLFVTGNCSPAENLNFDRWHCSFAVDSNTPKTVIAAWPEQTEMPQMELKETLSTVTLNNASDLTIDGLEFTWTDTEIDSTYANFNIFGTTHNVKIINNIFDFYVPQYGTILLFNNTSEDSDNKEIVIEGNTFTGRFGNAISLINGATVGAIRNNNFINPYSYLFDQDLYAYGISITENSQVKGDIAGNTFTMMAKAIYGNSASLNGSIANNNIDAIISGIEFEMPVNYPNDFILNQIFGDISGNQITIASNQSAQNINDMGYGMNIQYTDLKEKDIKNNSIYNQANRPYSVYLNYTNPKNITNNKIEIPADNHDICIGLLVSQLFTKPSSTVTIANNDSINSYYGISLFSINAPVEFYNNVLTTNNTAVVINQVGKINFKNNSIYNPKTDYTVTKSAVLIENSPNTYIYNSIIDSDLAAIEIYDLPDASYGATKLISDNNLFYNRNKNIQFIIQGVYNALAQWQGLGYDKTSFVVNPLYVNTVKESFDLHLRALSLAIDKGNNNLAPPTSTDKDGNPRIVTGRNKGNIDIGAYEYQK